MNDIFLSTCKETIENSRYQNPEARKIGEDRTRAIVGNEVLYSWIATNVWIINSLASAIDRQYIMRTVRRTVVLVSRIV